MDGFSAHLFEKNVECGRSLPSMIHTIYSNSYEVLRAVLLNNIDALRLRPEAESLRADE